MGEKEYILRADVLWLIYSGKIMTGDNAEDSAQTLVKESPPHGRLIDADALLKKCEFACTDDDVDVRVVRCSVIEAAPTIIPAEPAEEGER